MLANVVPAQLPVGPTNALVVPDQPGQLLGVDGAIHGQLILPPSEVCQPRSRQLWRSTHYVGCVKAIYMVDNFNSKYKICICMKRSKNFKKEFFKNYFQKKSCLLEMILYGKFCQQ